MVTLSERLREQLHDVQVTAVIDLQYGDGGKGKVVDMLMPHVDVVVRCHGGPNAGNTVMRDDIRLGTHLLPPGILHDGNGKVNIIGQGVAVNLEKLAEEIKNLDTLGLSHDNLLLSRDAPVILPYHLIRDQGNKSQKDGGIGTTGRGVGPCYADEAARVGLFVKDLLEEKTAFDKIRRVLSFYPEYCSSNEIETEAEKIVMKIVPIARRMRPFITNTTSRLHDMIAEGKRVLLAGSHGTHLSYKHGASPYVTSSDCSVNGVATGAGISARLIGKVFGVVKYPFMCRVGGGPFPTELGGEASEIYCAMESAPGKALHDREEEAARHKNPINLANGENEFEQGIGIRMLADEYGTTTGRPRRVGWTDAVATRYSVRVNGPMTLVLTKADCLDGVSSFSTCYGYQMDGQDVPYQRDHQHLRRVLPVLKTYPGYVGIKNARSVNDLPSRFVTPMKEFEEFVGAQVGIVSVGREAHQTIVVN